MSSIKLSVYFYLFILILPFLYTHQLFSEDFTEANGWRRHTNGGGLVHRYAYVTPNVFVGKNVKVFAGRVTGGRLEDFVEFRGGRMEGGILAGTAKVFSGSRIRGGMVNGNAELRGGIVNGGTVGRNAIIGQRVVVRNGMVIRNQRLGHIPHLQTSRGNQIRRTLQSIPYVGRVIGIGSILLEILKTSLSASELEKATGAMIGEALYSTDLASSDLPIEDYLQNLKTATQYLPPQRFSEERQALSNELRTVYTDIQTDNSLTDKEKETFLKTIVEIQDTVQPPNVPRHPPTHRNESRGISSDTNQNTTK